MTQVLVCSDQTVLVRHLESELRRSGGYRLLPCCSTSARLPAHLARAAPDIVLIDLTPEVTFAMLTETRRATAHGKMILWANTISTELALEAVALGVRGILRKTLPPDLQVKCLERVRDGGLWFEKALTNNLPGASRLPLSPRENELITLLSQGLKNKEIASVLSISEGLLKVYLVHLFEKLGVKDRFELALFGLKNSTGGSLPAGEKSAALTPVRSLSAGFPNRYDPSRPVPLPTRDRIFLN